MPENGQEVEKEIRVLLIEDNPDDTLLIQELLAGSPGQIQLVCAPHLDAAFDEIARRRFDAILLDLKLPGSDANETLSRLRAHAPHAPVVVLTGAEEETLEGLSLAHGVRAYLQKQKLQDENYLAKSLRRAISRRETDRALLETLAQLRLALESSRAGTWRWSVPDGPLIFEGPIDFDGDLGRRAIELDEFLSFIQTEDRAAAQVALQRARDHGAECSLEYRILPRDGSERTMLLRGRPSGHESKKIVGVCWDVTAKTMEARENKKLEERIARAQKLESLELLAGGVAHDFNNFLTTILGSIGLARREVGMEHAGYPLLADIETATLGASDLTQQLLAYSGKGRFVVRQLDLSSVVRETESLLKSTIGPNTTLRFNLSEQAVLVRGDATQIRQVLMNLVRNGSEAMDGREGIVSITTGHQTVREGDSASYDPNDKPRRGDYAVLEVSDTGMGMSKDTQGRLFEPFFTTKVAGRGLGLAAVMGIVRGHSGHVRLYSEPGRGTSLRILLPVAKANDDEPETTELKGRGRVIVADDNESVRTTVNRMLSKLGFVVLTAADGRELVDLFRVHGEETRLLLIDLAMPRLSGEETVMEIRRMSADVPIVLMSGYNSQEISDRLVGRGVAGFLQKPFQYQALEAVIASALAERD